MVLVVRKFIGTRDPLIHNPLIRDPLNTYTPFYKVGVINSSPLLIVLPYHMILVPY